MKRILAAIAATTMLSACMLQPGEFEAVPLTAAQEVAVKSAIAYRLRDASSARWRGLTTINHISRPSYVCGQVNSTNGFGGYTGFVHFWGRWNADGSFGVQGWPTQDFAAANATICPG